MLRDSLQSQRVVIVLVSMALGLAACGGDGPTDPQRAPTFASVTAGALHTCALTPEGVAYCRGANSHGQLGGEQSPGEWVRVAGGLTFASLSASRNYTCGVTSAGAAYCWGENDEGQLGDGTVGGHRSTPVRIPDMTFSVVTAGAGHTCGLTPAGAAYCWGTNSYGELGDGTLTARSSPTPVSGGLTFVSLEASHFHTCGLTAAGAAYCWGPADRGRLGDGTSENVARTTPVPVAGNIVFKSLGATHGGGGCGLTASGAAYCWGWNDKGGVGDGTTTDRWAPVAVSGDLAFREIGTGGLGYACGLTMAGAVYCWGANDTGRLGDGTFLDRLTPVLASDVAAPGRRFTALGVGEGHSCAVDDTATMYCWPRDHPALP